MILSNLQMGAAAVNLHWSGSKIFNTTRWSAVSSGMYGVESPAMVDFLNVNQYNSSDLLGLRPNLAEVKIPFLKVKVISSVVSGGKGSFYISDNDARGIIDDSILWSNIRSDKIDGQQLDHMDTAIIFIAYHSDKKVYYISKPLPHRMLFIPDKKWEDPWFRAQYMTKAKEKALIKDLRKYYVGPLLKTMLDNKMAVIKDSKYQICWILDKQKDLYIFREVPEDKFIERSVVSTDQRAGIKSDLTNQFKTIKAIKRSDETMQRLYSDYIRDGYDKNASKSLERKKALEFLQTYHPELTIFPNYKWFKDDLRNSILSI